MNIPHRTVIDIAGPYDAKSIYALISAETTLTGVRLAFDGLLAQAMSAPLGVSSHAALVEALRGMTEHYVDLASSGDCGFWDPEKEPQVIAARAALQLAEPNP